MPENRRYNRVRFPARGIITIDGNSHEGRVVNISPTGAMVALSTDVHALPGYNSSLAVYSNTDDQPLHFSIEIVHSCFSTVGVRFISMDAAARDRLRMLLNVGSAERKIPKGQLSLFCREGD